MTGGNRREALLRILKTLLVGLVITWGLLALVVRAMTPLLADYREEVAALAAERLGAPVAIGSLKARWYGLRPLLELNDVTIGARPQALHVRRVELDIALTGLLHGPTLDALRVTLDGLQLTAVRETSGQFHLEGLGTGDRHADTAGALTLPSHLRLVNTRVLWIDRRPGRAPVPLDDVDILFDRDGENMTLRASLQTPAGRAETSAELRGVLGGTDWEGDSYVRVDNLDVARLLRDYLPAHYGLDGALLDLQAWIRWQDAMPVHSQGRLALRDVRLHPDDGAALDLRLLAANFSYQRTTDGLRLGLQGLDLATAEQRWPRSDLALALRHDADGNRHLDLAAGFLRLEDVARILQVRMPDPRLGEALDGMQPRGDVHALRLSASLAQGAASWRARAGFRRLHVNAWKRQPGVDNLSGRLLGHDGHLALTLDSRDTRLHFPGLFRDPLELPRIAGRVDWTGGDAGWELESRSLQADAAHIRTLNRVHLRQQPGGGLFMDLQTDFRDGDAAFASRYYPTGIMKDSLVRWLDGAIEAGRVIGGSALVHGPLGDFPFESTRSGTFQVVFDTDDIHLDYRDGWPAITGLDAHVKFHGNQLDISSTEGAVYDNHIDRVSARIESLKPASAIRIEGAISGSLQDKLRVLGEPALRPRFGEFADILRAAGDSQLQLDFTVPLGKTGRYSLDGQLTFADNRLSLPDWDFALHAIDGRLDFSLDGLRADGIRAHALGAPLSVDVVTHGDGTTRVRAQGRLNSSGIAEQLDQLPLAAASGRADFVIDVDVPPRRTSTVSRTMLTVRSDLKGIGIDLPEPLGKTADQVRELTVAIPLGGNDTAGSVRYADRLSALFSRDGTRVHVQLGGDATRLREQPGIRVAGRVPRLDVAAWQAAIDRLQTGNASATPPVDIDLRIGRAAFNGSGIDDLQLNARHDAGTWQGKVQAAMLAGSFVIPLRDERPAYQLDLQHLHLELPEDDDAPKPRPDVAAGPDPTGLPGLILNVADLQLGEAHLGALQLIATPGTDGLQIERMHLQGGQLDLDARGAWSREQRAAYRTRLSGQLETANLGQLLVDLGYSHQFEEATANGRFDFEWPGNPAQLHRSTLAGRLDVNIENGRLVELDPGVTRVVGLLNLNALTRRLRLDFSDLFEKGQSFDRISGGFEFADGVAQTQDLTLAGPTGRIDIEGSTDLVAEVFDQHVMVTPNLDATLPIASTIAGGPVAGIAVLVAQKALSNQVDRINRFDYSVTGPWAQPEIKQLESGGTLSKLLKPFSGRGAEASGQEVEQTPAAETSGSPQSAKPVQAPEPATAAPATAPADGPPSSPRQAAGDERDPVPERKGGPLRNVLDFLKRGEPYGSDIPGEWE